MYRSVVSYVYDYAARASDVALVYKRRLRRAEWTYARLAASSFQFARELETCRIRKGDRVVIWAENCPAWVAAFYGCLLRGAIVVPIDEQSTPEFVTQVCEQARPKLLLRGSSRTPDTKISLPVVLLDQFSEIIARHSSDVYPAPEINGNDLAQIIFTSGTTAAPKGVQLTHDNLMAHVEPLEREINKYIKWERLVHPIRILCLVPLSHVFGQMMGMFVPPLLKAEVFFLGSHKPTQIIETIKRERISALATVPRVLQTLEYKIERDQSAKGRLDHFRGQLAAAKRWNAAKRWWKFLDIHRMFGLKFWAFVTGGAHLEADTEEFWLRLGFAVVQGYGMTETAALISLNNPFDVRTGSLGEVMPGQEVKLDESGEILVRGRSVTTGYWGLDHMGRDDEGWFHTGDIGEKDASGRLYFRGRKKDVIVTAAGLNIYPEDIEIALNRQPEIRESTVVGIEGQGGPEPVAAIILRSKDAKPEKSIARANESLAPYQRVRRWVVWPEADFPRTTTQKVRRPLVAEFVRQQLAGGEVALKSPTVLAQLIEAIGGREAAIGLDRVARLGEDLKLDSLARVELLSTIEDRYQVELDEGAFTDATTVGDVEKMIQAEGFKAEAPRFSYPRWAQRFPLTWLRLIFYYTVILPFTLALCWVRVRGRNHLALINGPVLFASNHITEVDHALILSALPARFRNRMAIAMDGELLQSWLHPAPQTPFYERVRLLLKYTLVVSLFNVFPLPRHSGFRQSFAYAGEAMDRGYNILIFPEGRRAEEGRMQPFQHGVGLLVTELEAPIVPVAISGLYELKALDRRFFAWPGTVSVTFGPPLEFEADASASEVAQELEHRIASLHVSR